jgi:hypothetical protein
MIPTKQPDPTAPNREGGPDVAPAPPAPAGASYSNATTWADFLAIQECRFSADATTVAPVPERSVLFSLEPRGVGTPMVESATSYMSRLAHAHHVTVESLLLRIVFPALRSNERGVPGELGNGYFRYACAINGPGTAGATIMSLFERLTSRNDLGHLTLHRYSAVLRAKGLQRRSRAWCPVCLDSLERDGEPVYEPLLWTFQDVHVCPIHRVPLETHCTNGECRVLQPVLPRRAGPGGCDKCGSWLGCPGNCKTPERETSRPEDVERELWNVEQIGRLLSDDGRETVFSPDSVFRFVLACVDALTRGNVAAFGRIVGVPKNTAWYWVHSRSTPTFAQLLKLSFLVRVPLRDCLRGEAIDLQGSFMPQKPPDRLRRRSPREIDRGEVVQTVERLTRKTAERRSVLDTCRQLDMDARVFRNGFPVLSKKIAERYRLRREEEKWRRIAELTPLIREKTEELYDSGIYPSQKAIEDGLGRRGLLRESRLKDFWHGVLTDLRVVADMDGLGNTGREVEPKVPADAQGSKEYTEPSNAVDTNSRKEIHTWASSIQ